ncbi:hypothetical protein AO377_1798 [Moraxella catarrhalis]|nr:hypothetical protein AO377_1798 [Moraxella catarrhalis]OAV14163.1 hypothetical protein AO375_1278 [Moraxella catarrhalis]OAV14546.1 hypothetical protein AO376_1136 [Moraxella catarrhalis]OAV16335.1 hypothetical protein AO374_1822 [Moraxella catarrhalis]
MKVDMIKNHKFQIKQMTRPKKSAKLNISLHLYSLLSIL